MLELGGDFTFVGRQRKLRIDDEWFKIDLLFYHRRLRCLIIIELKLDKLTAADVGQVHMYCNYARKHWMLPDENPPVGLILCAGKGRAVAEYALEGLHNKILAADYRVFSNYRTKSLTVIFVSDEFEGFSRVYAAHFLSTKKH